LSAGAGIGNHARTLAAWLPIAHHSQHSIGGIARKRLSGTA
jgi:hypothetical protein